MYSYIYQDVLVRTTDKGTHAKNLPYVQGYTGDKEEDP